MQADAPLLPLPRKKLTEMEYGAKPYLIDPKNGISRFSNGVCRYLDRVTPPWKVSLADDGQPYINDLDMSLHAQNTAFGIPVPEEPFDPFTTRQKWVIDLGIVDTRTLSGREMSMRDAIIDPSTHGKPKVYEESYSQSFNAYRLDIGGNTVLINQELQAAAYCDVDRSWPNPFCEGVVLLNDEESATFRISLDGLQKLEEVTRSIRTLAAAMRAECPVRR